MSLGHNTKQRTQNEHRTKQAREQRSNHQTKTNTNEQKQTQTERTFSPARINTDSSIRIPYDCAFKSDITYITGSIGVEGRNFERRAIEKTINKLNTRRNELKKKRARSEQPRNKQTNGQQKQTSKPCAFEVAVLYGHIANVQARVCYDSHTIITRYDTRIANENIG